MSKCEPRLYWCIFSLYLSSVNIRAPSPLKAKSERMGDPVKNAAHTSAGMPLLASLNSPWANVILAWSDLPGVEPKVWWDVGSKVLSRLYW